MFTGKFQPRRLFRLHWNRKHKRRDRHHSKRWRGLGWQRRHMEPDLHFNRRRTHCETGYGVAYETNPDAGSYGGRGRS